MDYIALTKNAIFVSLLYKAHSVADGSFHRDQLRGYHAHPTGPVTAGAGAPVEGGRFPRFPPSDFKGFDANPFMVISHMDFRPKPIIMIQIPQFGGGGSCSKVKGFLLPS